MRPAGARSEFISGAYKPEYLGKYPEKHDRRGMKNCFGMIYPDRVKKALFLRDFEVLKGINTVFARYIPPALYRVVSTMLDATS